VAPEAVGSSPIIRPKFRFQDFYGGLFYWCTITGMKLDQHAQFIPTRDNVQQFLSHYGLTLGSFEAAKSGIENCTLIIRTNADKHVLRVYRQANKSLQQIRQELAFVRYLHDHGVAAVACIANSDNDEISEFLDGNTTWHGILMPFVEGDEPKTYTSELIEDMANAQATMHQLSANYVDPYAEPKSNLRTGLTPFMALTPQQKRTLDSADLLALVGRAEHYTLRFDPGLPRGLCHTDFCNGNLLVDQRQHLRAVLDFDDLRDVPYAVCLAYTLWDLYMQDPRIAEQYVALYEKTRPISETERSTLQPYMLFRHYMVATIKASSHDFPPEEVAQYVEVERRLLASNIT
jgi:Ser/Thr protein kinase RdoA (MazF antagonist)